jgi:hypothetical protein
MTFLWLVWTFAQELTGRLKNASESLRVSRAGHPDQLAHRWLYSVVAPPMVVSSRTRFDNARKQGHVSQGAKLQLPGNVGTTNCI